MPEKEARRSEGGRERKRDPGRGKSGRREAPPARETREPRPPRENREPARPPRENREPDRARADAGARREPRRVRDDDLGPAVRGFGGDVPAFMLVAARPRRQLEPTHTTGVESEG
ncbi:MAG: hypothetical protein JOY70_11720 [Acidisphaera sp.]|nr:hypothetical protein [Acidisphaera sp.]